MFVVMAGDLLVPMEGNHGRSSHSNVNAMAQVFLGLVVAFSGSLLFLMDGACQARQLSQRKAEENGVRNKFALIDASAPQAAHCVWVVFEPILPAF